MTVPTLLRVAAIIHWFVAVGFGVFCFPAIRNLLMGRDIPIVMGFPAYGRGPFERAGIPTTVPLLAAFLLVCILEAVAGFLLWQGYMSGAILALVLLPAGVVFCFGFAMLGFITVKRRLLRWQQLKADGQLVEGRIISLQHKTHTNNQRTYNEYIMRYELITPSNRLLTGKIRLDNERVYNELKVGMQLAALYVHNHLFQIL